MANLQEWELVNASSANMSDGEPDRNRTLRMSVPGGWLYLHETWGRGNKTESMVFVRTNKVSPYT